VLVDVCEVLQTIYFAIKEMVISLYIVCWASTGEKGYTAMWEDHYEDKKTSERKLRLIVFLA